MPDLFPVIQPEAEIQETELPLYRETAWDFTRGQPIFRAGRPAIAEGIDAIKVWAWKALMTQRARYEIYSQGYGSEVESLIGQPYTDDLKRAEAARYVREALEINPYITEIIDISVNFADGKLSIAASINTIYGEVNISAG